MFGIEKTRAHFPRSFRCQTQTEMKNGISDIGKAIAKHLGERTRSRFYPITHTATTLQSTFALIAVRAIPASAHMIFVRKTFGFASFFLCRANQISKGKFVFWGFDIHDTLLEIKFWQQKKPTSFPLK